MGEVRAADAADRSVAVSLSGRMFGSSSVMTCVTHARNIFAAGYEFEADRTAIS
jgi:hypothetical protein